MGNQIRRDGEADTGREIELLELDADEPVEQGDVGEISLRLTGEVLFVESYFEMPEKSAEKFGGEWLRSD